VAAAAVSASDMADKLNDFATKMREDKIKLDIKRPAHEVFFMRRSLTNRKIFFITYVLY